MDELDGFNPDDEEAFNAFMQNDSTQQGSLLADIIMAKLQKKAQAQPADDGEAEEEAEESGMTEEMATVYQDVGKLLSRCVWPAHCRLRECCCTSTHNHLPDGASTPAGASLHPDMRANHRYTAGKLPKAFKVIPHLRNWEEVLFMTSPQTWSPHATLAATKMFVSQLPVKQVQRFLNLILLNVVRDDIREHRRLHFALFQAVKKSVFKPGAFYKGFILPLLKQGDCTLREAVILAAVLNRVSIPMDHSAAARPPNPPSRLPHAHPDA